MKMAYIEISHAHMKIPTWPFPPSLGTAAAAPAAALQQQQAVAEAIFPHCTVEAPAKPFFPFFHPSSPFPSSPFPSPLQLQQ